MMHKEMHRKEKTMSNVSLVSICRSFETALIGIGEGVGAVCVGAANAVRWLSEETPEDCAAVEMLKAVRRQERLHTASGVIMPQCTHPLRSISPGIPTPVSKSVSHSTEKLVIASSRTPVRANAESLQLTTASLHLRDTESLVRSAEKLGYKVTKPAVSKADDSRILLARATGERLALGRDTSGSLVLQTAGQQERIQALVRQHTLDRATEHLESKGMSLQTAKLPNGEVQILAREQQASRRGGAAELKTQIRADGTVLVDVDKVKGGRCEGIVRDLAEAVGGEVSKMKKKDSFFQLPGEPAKAKVRV